MLDPKRTILRLILIAIVAVALGTAGYMVIEKWSLGDALYMTAITLSTVGFGEVNKLNTAGRLFTVLLFFSEAVYFFISSAGWLSTLCQSIWNSNGIECGLSIW